MENEEMRSEAPPRLIQGSVFLRLYAEDLIRIGTAMIKEANRLDGIETYARGHDHEPKLPK